MSDQHLDVLVVGAGLSGIGAGYRLQSEHPQRRYLILEARDRVGGTWDLFRYPGVRSDSDMHTLGYPFRPWTGTQSFADGRTIRAYIRQTAAAFGIDQHIRFGRRVTAASWSSADARWLVTVETSDGTGQERYTCDFLYLCSGYYSYRSGHQPRFPGIERFSGRVVHPQQWPDDVDVRGRRIVVIGSGATAVTLVPALAEKAAHVTMLQRSPSYVAVLSSTDGVAALLSTLLPASVVSRVIRWKNVVTGAAFYQLCRRAPAVAKRILLTGLHRQLSDPGHVETHFTPDYNPWDQRVCVAPDGDLFREIRCGRVSVVTDRIEQFTESGIRLASGRELPADIVISATGLTLQMFGGIQLTVDGTPVQSGERFVYRGCMLSGVPNLALCVGYTNASWTLRADLTSRYVCRLLRYLDRHGFASATPRLPGPIEARPLLPLTSGYVRRAEAILPKQGARSPWRMRQNYFLDAVAMRFADITRDMEFAPRSARVEGTGPAELTQPDRLR